METKNKYVPMAIVAAGLLIAAAIFYRPIAPIDNSNQPAEVLLAKIDAVSPTEHLLGKTEAPLALIVYSDLECPFCKAFHFTTQSLNKKYGEAGQLAIVFRQFPLSIHSQASTEAAAAECAAKLGGNEKFWQYLDRIFSITPSNNGLDLALLPKLATDLGIDETKFKACLNDDKTKKLIANEVKKATDLGIDGTPFVILIGPKGEKIFPFYEQVPDDWSDTNKKIVVDLMTTYQAEIEKLRNAQK